MPSVTLFTPHKAQLPVIEQFANSEHKFGVVVAGRQIGKSLLGQNLMLYWLLQTPNQKGGWVSPIYNQAKKVFEELSNASHQLIASSNKAELTIKFINGSTLQFLSAERYDSIRGFSFNYVVVDEAAFIRREAIDEAILPTLTSIGKKCLIISTPKSKNWFYDYYLRGTTSNNVYISFKAISQDSPYIDKNFLLEQQKSLPVDIYKQEYLAEFSESTNDVYRGLDAVCILNTFENEGKSRRYYAGIDTGISNDYTVLAILDESGRTATILRFTGKSFEESAKEIVRTLKRFNIAGGFCETNSIGAALFELIKGYNRKIKPFTTTQDSKTTGVRKMIADIENGELLLPSKQLLPECYNELASYTYKVSANGKLSFSHPPGMHDDIHDALMFANLARQEFGGNRSSIYISPMNSQKRF